MRPYGAPGGDPGAAPPAPGMRPHAQPWSGPEEPPFADQFSALSLASSWRPTAAPPPPPPRPAPAADVWRAPPAAHAPPPPLGLLAPSVLERAAADDPRDFYGSFAPHAAAAVPQPGGGGGGGALSGEEASLAAYVTGLPVAMRPWELAAAFRDCGAARAELLPIKFPGKGTRSGLVVFATPEGIQAALARSPLSVAGAKLVCRRFGGGRPAAGGATISRDERQALSRQGVLIFVGSIPTNATDVEVKAAFGVFGNVVRCWSFLTTSGQQDLLCAFVVFADVASANRAVDSHRAGGRVAIGGRFVVIERPSGSEAAGAGRAGARHDDRFLPWRLRRAGFRTLLMCRPRAPPFSVALAPASRPRREPSIRPKRRRELERWSGRPIDAGAGSARSTSRRRSSTSSPCRASPSSRSRARASPRG